ncbi:flagellar hook-basal body complex protein FliE [Granulicella tundricola]|uniref:Flagellar hook-basal body complex protein FliE n=1 Tax=Granulicella tundricola (strain ATCC BAA-1859 / DSM 23138 / MP5ACTX9) TaxID=1198114 RepID=E8X644_GRATM|nr:flagellar hook-basal body complex protein FliE [Granulicella tundricola]ADW70928.1 flagellar hook-basal body complex subunit FliE [Granulicella tundricola MP5ACTX9]
MNIPIGGMSIPIPTGMTTPSFGGMTDPSQSGGFSDVLKGAISQVSNLEGSANQQVNRLIQGGNADMSKVMISVEKADVAFQLMMQVRNKIVSAYQDIEKMQF